MDRSDIVTGSTTPRTRPEIFTGTTPWPTIVYPCLPDPETTGKISIGTSTDGTEVRVVDPATGGAKGVKPARFDLIPPVELKAMLAKSGEFGSCRSLMNDFWAGGPIDLVLKAGRTGLMDLSDGDAGYPGGATPKSLWTLAEVYGYGAKKYHDEDHPITGDYNWARGYRWGYSYGAAIRHLNQRWREEIMDDESGLPHMAHFVWHCLTLAYFSNNGIGVDDRLVTLRRSK